MRARAVFVNRGQWIPERTSFRYSGVLSDDAGQLLPPASLQSLTLTLYDLEGYPETETIINGVDHLDILNEDRGSLDGQGNLAVDFRPGDAVILDADHPYEKRLALLEWSYESGVKHGKHEIEFVVRNLGHVPPEMWAQVSSRMNLVLP